MAAERPRPCGGRGQEGRPGFCSRAPAGNARRQKEDLLINWGPRLIFDISFLRGAWCDGRPPALNSSSHCMAAMAILMNSPVIFRPLRPGRLHDRYFNTACKESSQF